MSADSNNDEADDEILCASCGVAGGDGIKLRKCTACYLVRYCGVKCQKEHRPKHKKECKKKAAELRDELLFKQPESSCFGDCPICCLPLPLPLDSQSKSVMMPCCSKSICDGCNLANKRRELEGRLQEACPFCRHPAPKSQVEAERIHMKRVEANDPVALRNVGQQRYQEGDYKGAIEYFKKAAELGDVMSHYRLSWSYRDGGGVEKDEKKEMYHREQAAIGGHPEARHNLGCYEWGNGQYERGARHFIIAAKLGYDQSMGLVKKLYQGGSVSKDDFASTLRAHKAAVDATKSPQREAAGADAAYCLFREDVRTGAEFAGVKL